MADRVFTACRPITNAQMDRAAIANPAVRKNATFALDLFSSYCAQLMPRIPGCDIWVRLAIQVHRGETREAAAGEYEYRWLLFLAAWTIHTKSRSSSRFVYEGMCYPAPHLLGR